MNVPEILRAAANLIEPEGAWTQGWFAKDALGSDTSTFGGDAVCWCAFGALERVLVRRQYDKLNDAVDALLAVIGEGMIGNWNDAPERTQAEVVAKLREAADLAERGAA